MANIYTKHKMVKHVGLLGDKRCLIIQQLPEDLDNVHVVDSDALPEIYHQALMSMVESAQAQQSVWFSEVLNRRVMPDGGNALQVLYQRGLVKIVPVTSVTMVPRPNQHVPLTDVINFMNGTADVTKENVNNELKANQQKVNENTLVNQYANNLAGDDLELRKAQARNIMVEAKMLQADVDKKLEIAYSIDPSLRPTVPVEEPSKPTKSTTFIDSVTGKEYKTAGALKAAETRRAKKAS